MINGMYLSTMGAMVQGARHDAIANNMANTNTTGFKPDWVSFRAIPAESVLQPGSRMEVDKILEQTGGGVWLEQTYTDFTPGAFQQTGNPLDLALEDEAGSVRFFMTRAGTPGSPVRYTRAGHFLQDAEGQIRTASGDLVLSAAGDGITLPPDATDIRIDDDGWITAIIEGENIQLAQVGVVQTSLAEARTMKKIGDNLFAPGDAAFDNVQAGVRSGVLEQSASDAVTEMVSMIEGHRTYEANMTFLRMQDETLGQTARRLGAVG